MAKTARRSVKMEIVAGLFLIASAIIGGVFVMLAREIVIVQPPQEESDPPPRPEIGELTQNLRKREEELIKVHLQNETFKANIAAFSLEYNEALKHTRSAFQYAIVNFQLRA